MCDECIVILEFDEDAGGVFGIQVTKKQVSRHVLHDAVHIC